MSPVSSRTTMKSRPLRAASGRSRQAPASSGRSRAGRRLAKRPRALRMPRSPRSGRFSGGWVSHLGPPTAERYTASEALHLVMVSSGRGQPVASMAAPPMWALSKVKVQPVLAPTASRTLRPSARISGPMPSPGRRQIFLFMGYVLREGWALPVVTLPGRAGGI